MEGQGMEGEARRRPLLVGETLATPSGWRSVRYGVPSLACVLCCFFGCVGATVSTSISDGAGSHSSLRRIDQPELEQRTVLTAGLGHFNKSLPLYLTDDGKHYMADVQLGWRSNASEPQVVRLIIDTGSGDTVVFGQKHCDAKKASFEHEAAGGRGGTNCYDHTRSASIKFNVDGLGRRINDQCRVDQAGHQGAFCKQALLIDGYKAELMCELAWEDVSFADPNSESSALQTIRTDICVVNDTETVHYKMRYWNQTQGTLGLFYSLCEPGQGEAKCETPFPPILSPNSMPPTYNKVFLLDLNGPEKASYLHFGDPNNGWGDMSWSETQPLTLMGRAAAFNFRYAFHSFEIFDMRMCGVDLLSNYSSHWTAMVDTGASCLSLPQEFFAMVQVWVPGVRCVTEHIQGYDFTDCANEECSEFKSILVCYLNAGVKPSDLPVISFRLGENDNILYLPLEDLVINDRPSGKPRLCINPTDSYAMYRSEQVRDLLYFPKISFGTLALRNLMTAFDMRALSVGFKNKKIFDLSRILGTCNVSTVCVGAQEAYAPLNMCIDPPCQHLYFHELNPQTHTCNLGQGFLISAIVTLLALALAEIALNEIYEKLARKLTATYATST